MKQDSDPTPAEIEARQVRLGCATLAVRLHEQDLGPGDTVVDTARQIADFVEGGPDA